MTRIPLPFLLVAALGAGAPARAQTDALATAVRHHEAVQAAELCLKLKFSPDQYDKVAVLVGQLTRQQLTVGDERAAIRDGRAHMKALVDSGGCRDPFVVEALRFFETFKDRVR